MLYGHNEISILQAPGSAQDLLSLRAPNPTVRHAPSGRRILAFFPAAALIAVSAFLGPLSAQSAQKVQFNRDIRPILSENCFHCHGQDIRNRMADLRLDLKESATQDRGGHAALVPGSLEKSALYERITAKPDDARHMPPVYSNRSLTAEQIELIKRWIEEGAEYEPHWAFVAPKHVTPPAVSDAKWPRQPIDSFILARLDAEGLKPSSEADPAIWLRRASLDLTGLPPSIEEMDAFGKDVAAHGEAAYEQAADRLLQSPRYGERMAMDWLDVSRYADTHGFNNDSTRSMWRWRDWVIESFNNNLPYDQFITKQLAGDLLPNPSLDDRVATGFNRNHVINSEGGIIDEEYRVEYVADRVRTVSMAWMGLSFECARCHDHKYDPIEQRDYYRLFAFFNNVPEFGEDGRVANAVPLISAPTRGQQQQLEQLAARVSALETDIDSRAARWHWKGSHAKDVLRTAEAARAASPRDTSLRITCDSNTGFEEDAEKTPAFQSGVVAQACASDPAKPLPELSKKRIELCDDRELTLSLWFNAAKSGQDAALFSAIDYSPDPASITHGRGIELRLIDNELELRLSERFPAYSITVRTQANEVQTGQWHHVAAIYRGSRASSQRAEASAVEIFIDGREVRTRVLHDDLANVPDFSKTMLLGRDNGRNTATFAGSLDETAVWTRALNRDEIISLFRSQALPYAVSQQQEGKSLHAAAPGWTRRELMSVLDKGYAAKLRQLDAVDAEFFEIWRDAPTSMVMGELQTRRPTHLLKRGRYDSPGEEVEPGVPEKLLGAWPADAGKDRLGLARWLTRPGQPLTSRVVVNRFWAQLFGVGIVKTVENFGFQGEWPSHPELLDWLATKFVDSGWDVKALMKMMVLSSTYRQDSAVSRELAARDPENRLLARGPRFRLPAEVIRDEALSLSGLLHNKVGGPSVRPYQPASLYEGIVVAANYPGTKWEQGHGDDLYRRSLYTFWKRTVPHPVMTVFDAPDREFCTVRRSVTNTPLQALTLLNSPVFIEASRKLAERMILEGGGSFESRIEFAFQMATGRKPDQVETGIFRAAYDKMLASFGDSSNAQSLLGVGESALNPKIPTREFAAYTAVASMLLNLDEVITKG